MSDKQWWEPLIEDDGKLDWLCDHEGDYSEKINELWAQFTALRLQLAEAIVVRDRSITRMVEMAEPGFIGAFAARDMAIERANKADAENAALREQLAKAEVDGARYGHVKQFLRHGNGTLDLQDTDSEEFDALIDALPRRERETTVGWVGLTDEEWQEIADKTDISIWSKLKQAIEAKFREKNGG